VEEAVLGLPFVLSASVVNESGNSGAVTLLIFTGPEPLELAHKLRSPREAALRERIRLRLGAEFQPALIEQYAMYPRRRDGALDQGWCRQQLQAGTLRSREAQPLLRLLDRLRAACARTLAFETSAPQAGTVPSKGEETPAAHGRKDSHR